MKFCTSRMKFYPDEVYPDAILSGCSLSGWNFIRIVFIRMNFIHSLGWVFIQFIYFIRMKFIRKKVYPCNPLAVFHDSFSLSFCSQRLSVHVVACRLQSQAYVRDTGTGNEPTVSGYPGGPPGFRSLTQSSLPAASPRNTGHAAHEVVLGRFRTCIYVP